MPDPINREPALIAVEKAWAAAHLALDLDSIENLLSDQYRQIQADGNVIGKDELLDSYRSGERRWDVAESDEYEIRIFGEVALLIGRWRGKGQNQGQRFDYTARFLAVYHFEGNAWKLVSDVSIPLDS